MAVPEPDHHDDPGGRRRLPGHRIQLGYLSGTFGKQVLPTGDAGGLGSTETGLTAAITVFVANPPSVVAAGVIVFARPGLRTVIRHRTEIPA